MKGSIVNENAGSPYSITTLPKSEKIVLRRAAYSETQIENKFEKKFLISR